MDGYAGIERLDFRGAQRRGEFLEGRFLLSWTLWLLAGTHLIRFIETNKRGYSTGSMGYACQVPPWVSPPGIGICPAGSENGNIRISVTASLRYRKDCLGSGLISACLEKSSCYIVGMVLLLSWSACVLFRKNFAEENILGSYLNKTDGDGAWRM